MRPVNSARNPFVRAVSPQSRYVNESVDTLAVARRPGNAGHLVQHRAQLATLSMMRQSKVRKRRENLQVERSDLGAWTQRWSASPLMGIMLLLALAPEGDLACRCAAACLMKEGQKVFDGPGSTLWKEMRTACNQAIARGARIRSVLQASQGGSPILVNISGCALWSYSSAM